MADLKGKHDRASRVMESGPFQAVPTGTYRRLACLLDPFLAGGDRETPRTSGIAVRGQELRVDIEDQAGVNVVTVTIAPSSAGSSNFIRAGDLDIGYLAAGGREPSPSALALVRRVGKALEVPGIRALVAATVIGTGRADAPPAQDFIFKIEGKLEDFSVDDCDRGAEEAPRRLGPRHMLVRSSNGLDVFITSNPAVRGGALIRAKGVLGRVRGPGGEALEPVNACRECPSRFECAACFQATDGPLQGNGPGPLRETLSALASPQSILGSSDFVKYVEGLAGRREDGPSLLVVEAAAIAVRKMRERLAVDLREAGPGAEVLVVGRDPVAWAGPVRYECGVPVAPAEAPLVAANLRDTVMRLSGYGLSGRDKADPWFLRYDVGTGAVASPIARHATIVVNRKCVTICRYCDLPLRFRRNMTLEEAFQLIEEAGVLGVDRMEFFGGEVTLRRDLFDLLAYSRRLGMQTFVTTTGVGLDDDYLRELAECRVTDLSVSVDSPVASVHDYLKNREGMHEAAVGAARKLKRFGAPWVGLNSVIVRENFRQLPGVVRLAADLGLDAVIFFFCQPVAEMGRRKEILNVGEARDLLETVLPECRCLASDAGISIGVRPALDEASVDTREMARRVSRALYCRIHDTLDRCRVAEDLFSIDPVGDVRLCNQPLMQFGEDAVVGNVNKRSLIKILASDDAAGFRDRAGRLDACRHCTFDHEVTVEG